MERTYNAAAEARLDSAPGYDVMLFNASLQCTASWDAPALLMTARADGATAVDFDALHAAADAAHEQERAAWLRHQAARRHHRARHLNAAASRLMMGSVPASYTVQPRQDHGEWTYRYGAV